MNKLTPFPSFASVAKHQSRIFKCIVVLLGYLVNIQLAPAVFCLFSQNCGDKPTEVSSPRVELKLAVCTVRRPRDPPYCLPLWRLSSTQCRSAKVVPFCLYDAIIVADHSYCHCCCLSPRGFSSSAAVNVTRRNAPDPAMCLDGRYDGLPIHVSINAGHRGIFQLRASGTTSIEVKIK